MLEVKKIGRSYGDFVAVDEVSFCISQGEIGGLLGHNGAGKTTIMKMLSGYLEPDTGSICINGLDLASRRKEVQQQIGYLPENLPVYPEMSVIDYLDYAASLKGLQGRERTDEIRRVVRDTEIGGKALAPISTLSRGYKQRVGVAQALLGKPRLLILDEPTNGLDPTQTEHMRELIRNIAQQATVLLSTHIMQEVEALCDRVLIVNAGRLVVDEKLSLLRQTSQLVLCCNLDRETLAELVQATKGISNIEIDTGEDMATEWTSYILDVNSTADARSLSAELVRAITAREGQVCRLAPRIRNLESLFREVSTGKPRQAGEELKNVA